MNGFVRTTHDKDGNYRDLPEWKTKYVDDRFIHFLDNHPKTTFEIISEILAYNKSYYPYGVTTDYDEICKSLICMLEYDMIRIEEIK